MSITKAQRKDRAEKMSNGDLLERILELTQGDDWEGSLTNSGYDELLACQNELSRRLIAIGFIDKEFTGRI